jgi:hypothetical protein
MTRCARRVLVSRLRRELKGPEPGPVFAGRKAPFCDGHHILRRGAARILALIKVASNRVRDTMRTHGRHWLEYDPVALAVLVIGIGIVELLVLSI